MTAPTLQEVMAALEGARATAMEKAAAARIPECGDFGGIAQDLDFCVGWLRANAERLGEIERDVERLAYLRHEFDELGGIDLHDRAHTCASAFGRDEPNEADYAAAVRDAIDAARAGRDGEG